MPKRTPREEQRETALLRSMEALGSFAVRNRRSVLLAGAVLCGVALIGTTHIRLETDYLEFFSPETRVRADNTLIAERLGGAQPLYVVIESDAPQTIRRPDTLAAIADLQKHLDGLEGVDSSLSVVDTLLLVQRALNPEAPREVPETQAEIDQLVQFLDPDQIAPVVVRDWSRANVVVRTRLSGTRSRKARSRACGRSSSSS
jgi:predicted RND superfamily exporter protein